VVELRPLGVSRVFTDGRDLFTENLMPGVSVYGERLVSWRGTEFRQWDPRRSKLAALLLKGWKILPLGKGSQVLYLGAASGTTVSHVSDLCPEGTVYAVEIARRAFQKLLDIAEARHNVLPILADASAPEAYAGALSGVDFVYQDVAQRDQVEILRKNLRRGGLHALGTVPLEPYQRAHAAIVFEFAH